MPSLLHPLFFVRWFAPAAILLSLALGGCASGHRPHLFDAGPGARFSGVAEQQVLARAQRVCGGYSVGERQLGSLLAGDDAFQALTLALYRGEMSNDEYVGQVYSLHPAADGNVPGTGCVIASLNRCLVGDCGLPKQRSQERLGQAVAAAPEETVAMPVAPGTEISVAPELEAGL